MAMQQVGNIGGLFKVIMLPLQERRYGKDWCYN